MSAQPDGGADLLSDSFEAFATEPARVKCADCGDVVSEERIEDDRRCVGCVYGGAD